MTEFTQGIHGAARRIYENNKTELLEKFTQEVLHRVATPKLD